MIAVPFAAARDLPLAVAAVREALRAHGVIGIPTESSYGLAVDPRDPTAVARVFAAKGRGTDKALLVVAASLEQAAALAVYPDGLADALARVWPAPLTVIARARDPLPGSGDTVGVRVPDHPLLRALLGRVGPLTATSANASGQPALVDPARVAVELGDHLALLLDGGIAPGGEPSTVLDGTVDPPRLVRRGAWTPPCDAVLKIV